MSQSPALEAAAGPMQLMQMITGHWLAAAIYAAAKLGLADRLKDGAARTSDQLADAVGAHGPSVYRVLRALASAGLFREQPDKTFVLAPLGEYLRSDHPQSMRSMSLFQGNPAHWQSWGGFLHSVRTGEPSFEQVHGMGFFDYCARDPEFAEAFDGAMTGLTAAAAHAVLEAYDFSGIGTLCDVGGGHGYLLSAVAGRYPAMEGIVYDLPHVVENTRRLLRQAGLAGRCQAVGGSFFEAVPAADAYISKHIIHDWDDEHALKILRNMRAAIRDPGRVLLVEAVIPPGGDPFAAKLIDLEMLHATHGGRERTEEEFRQLFEGAGFRLQRIVATPSYLSVLEAVPA